MEELVKFRVLNFSALKKSALFKWLSRASTRVFMEAVFAVS
jgi:hypothetical protein